ncbi:MAG: hypothetical protein JNL97_10130, partial [Verrucomicrobiales bacterium]|nr:hypothetical protein [Verrucomicrobiales bacterium]
MARVLERWVLVSTLLTAAGFGALAVEPEAPLWSIGVFDESSAEFRPWVHAETGERLIDYADPRSDGRVRVGSGQETVGWPAYQPGSSNGGAGFREHPGLVEFVMGRAPEQDLELRLSLLAYSARLPVVQVGVNGRRGWWYQQPRPTSSAGDPAVFFQPHYSSSPLRCRLPASWFRAGTNRLEIVAVDVPGDREDVRPAGFPWPGCSGLVYDAMALHETTESAVPVEVRVEPTIFHRLRDGRLMEEVDVVVRRADRAPKGRMRVTMGEARAEAEFGSERERDAGEARVTMELPAWEGERELQVRLEFGGEVREFRRTVAAGRRWRLWWVAHEHLDIGYTDYDAKVAELHARVVDDAMELAERHPDFSLTLDGFWVVDRYRAGRTDGQVARMVRAVREGRIHVPVVHGSLFTGSATLEGLVRGLYPSRAFAREHGTPFDVAIVTDVPSYAWSWASVLAASGVKYFVGASDAYRGPFLLRNRLHELGAH